MRQAQKAMADAMGVGAAHQAVLEQQWAIMRATADAVRGDVPEAAETPLATSQHLAQARSYFDVAVETVRALSDATNAAGDESLDQVVQRFHARLDRIRDDNTN